MLYITTGMDDHFGTQLESLMALWLTLVNHSTLFYKVMGYIILGQKVQFTYFVFYRKFFTLKIIPKLCIKVTLI